MNLRVRLLSALTLLVSPFTFAHPPSGIAVDDRGRVYFMQAGVGVWMIDEHGTLSKHEGPGFHHVQLDPAGAFVNQRWPHFPDGVIEAVGENPTLLCFSSFPSVIGSDGALYYPEAKRDRRVYMLRLEPGGKPTEFALLPEAMEISFDGSPEVAQWIHGLAVGPDGNLYYAEKEGIRRIDSKGVVTTVVDKIALAECVRPPAVTDDRGGVVLRGLDVAPDGHIYAASAGCSCVVKVTQSGEVSIALQETDGWAPTDVAAIGTEIFVEEFYYVDVPQASDWYPRVRKLAADGTVTTLATAPDPRAPADAK